MKQVLNSLHTLLELEAVENSVPTLFVKHCAVTMEGKERFSLLLLEPNEIYFEDFEVTLLSDVAPPRSAALRSNHSPPLQQHHQQQSQQPSIGRLKMCSKTLVFVPRDHIQPILKLAYRDCTHIYEWEQTLFEPNAEVLAVRVTQHTQLLAANRLAPYEVCSSERLLRFKLRYGHVSQPLEMLGQLRRAATLPACDQNDMIATIVYSRHKRLQFDPLWLDDYNEPIVIEHTVDEISPLVTNPGRLLLTNRCVYFQPYNNILPYPVKKLPLSCITAVTKRRFLLRHTGLEIQYTDPSSSNDSDDDDDDYTYEQEPTPIVTHLLYVSFRSVADRTAFHDRLRQQPSLCVRQTPAESMTLRWQNGHVSNYAYLMHLNSLADRTAQDLTQYPVMPWVLQDYKSADLDLSDASVYRDLSKPMGALNAERLHHLLERCEEMGEPKFLYGSHYSAPALVLFYLVRRHPKLMLCLQNGRFDHPDRMFNSVAETFANCLKNVSDFKELIPEFYDVDALDGDSFLLNCSKTDFGVRHTGEPVNHVQLPPWAHRSPKLFVQTLRAALESEHVSKNLHHWIDLIFGYKQRGEEAVKANNLFYHLCYEGSVDLDSVPDLATRHALEVQISEFGQIPKQLFDQPHVQRLVYTAPPAAADTLSSPSPQTAAKAVGGDNDADVVAVPRPSTTEMPAIEQVTGGEPTSIKALRLCAAWHSHRDLIGSVHQLGDTLVSAGKDGLLKWCNIATIGDRENGGNSSTTQPPCNSVPIGSLPLSACVPIPGSNRIVLGSWDNTIITYNLDYGRITNTFVAHDDVVSCLSLVDNDAGILVSGSLDCSVKMWYGFRANDDQHSIRSTDALCTYLPLDERIASVHAIPVPSVAPQNPTTTTGHHHRLQILIGTYDGHVHLWRPQPGNAASGRFRALPHESSALHAHSDEVTAVRFDPGGRRAASCGLDGVLLVSDVQTGMLLFRAEHSAAGCCLEWPRAVSAAGDVLLLGDDRGAISVWSMQTAGREALLTAFGGGDGDGGEVVGGGLVSAMAAFRRSSKALDAADELWLVAAGVDYPRDFGVKLFRVV